MEAFKPREVRCLVGETTAIVNIRGSELVDNAQAYVEEICPGCQRWSKEELIKTEEEVKQEWGEGTIHRDREDLLTQHLVDLSRFKRVEREIVVGRCAPPY